MESYDEIREHLARKLHEAIIRQKSNSEDLEAADALKNAREQYESFTLHGLIPDELSE